MVIGWFLLLCDLNKYLYTKRARQINFDTQRDVLIAIGSASYM